MKASIKVRTYERGVEDETLSCGTGVTAAAIGASQKGVTSPVTVNTRGGILKVAFAVKDGSYSSIRLTGPATPVFEGTIEI